MCRIVLAATLAVAALAPAADPPTRAEIAKATKPAVAAIHSGQQFASAACVSPRGYFVTVADAIPPAVVPLPVTVVVNAGEKEEKVYPARLVRVDRAAGLALVRVETDDPLPVVALGDETKVIELDEVLPFGHPGQLIPSGKGDGKMTYPTVTVAKVKVTSLKREKGVLSAVQTELPVALGTLGGPVLDLSGKVVGVLCDSGSQRGVNGQFIPANVIRRFLARPDVTLIAADADPAKKFDPATVRAEVFALPDLPADEAVELVVRSGGRERRVEMKQTSKGYEASVAPFVKGDGSPPVAVEMKYPDGGVRGEVPDRKFTAGGKEYALSGVAGVRFGKWPGVNLPDGTAADGEVKGLDEVAVSLGGKAVTLPTAAARELVVVRPTEPDGGFRLTAVVRRNGREVGRAETLQFVTGTAPFGQDGMRIGRLTKPPEDDKASTWAVIAADGDKRLNGRSLRYLDKKVRASVKPNGDQTAVVVEWDRADGPYEEPRPSFTNVTGGLSLVMPKGDKPEAKVYPKAMFAGIGRITSRPAITFGSEVQHPQLADADYAIWEIETDGKNVTKLAADAIVRLPEPDPPVFVQVRINSRFK